MSSIMPSKLAEALLDASRQRARRVSADARLKEKEAGEAERAFGKEDLLKARKEVGDARARVAGEKIQCADDADFVLVD